MRYKAILRDAIIYTDDYADDEMKALYDVLERRNELSRSCIICSQRDPKAWPSMLMEDEVSANSILKRVTKHYSVMIERKLAE